MPTLGIYTLPSQRVPQKILKKSISLYYDNDAQEVMNIASMIASENGFKVKKTDLANLYNEKMTSSSKEENQEEDELELCDFCRPQGCPRCMKCLLGGNNRKIVKFGPNNNIHGFNN